MKILAVDDHPLIRHALRDILKQLDPDTELFDAQSAGEAMLVADQHPDLDLVLLDLTLPDVSGIAALTMLREAHPNTPVVMLSATEDYDVVMNALDCGAMGFIPKTSRNEVLLAALRLVLSGGIYLPSAVIASHLATAHLGPGMPTAGTVHAKTPAEIGLTERQTQVLALLLQGKPNKTICRLLKLAEGTVKVHITAILRTLNVRNRTEAVVAVSRLGLKFDRLPAGSGGEPASPGG